MGFHPDQEMADHDEQDLDHLLDSALEGFAKESRSTEAAGTSAPQGLGHGLGKGLPSLEVSKKKAKAKPGSSSKASETLQKLAEQTRNTVKSFETDDGDDLSEEAFIESMTKQFDALGTQDLESIMGTVMQQILSKDLLHEPMKEIGERYPSWLEANKGRLSSEDYARYSKQHKLIIELCKVYEETPEDFQKVVDLMQNMQSCGQPPPELVEELAPGVQLGEDGLPTLPNFPLGSEGAPDNCSIM